MENGPNDKLGEEMEKKKRGKLAPIEDGDKMAEKYR